jgi:SAM-dependent methyltransferase
VREHEKQHPAASAALSPRIFVSTRGHLREHVARTVDFAAAEMAALMKLEQIYAPRRGRQLGLWFDRDLTKLRVARLCRGCESRGSCPRIYVPVPDRVFARLERALKGIVGRLRGTVLEIGCGSIRFRELIMRRVKDGALRYVGIDPVLPTQTMPRGATLLCRSIEDFSARDSSFDKILLLRSYNHIRSPAIAFPKIRRLLRPGGRLIVVDGSAFGLVLSRRPRPARPGDFEHFRNHTSAQAKAVLEGFGFTVIRETPITAASSNEWLLILRK